MNILLINHYAGSSLHGMEYRPFYLAREWVKQGHSVTVVTATFSHLRIRQDRACKSRKEEFIEGVRYVWLRTPRYHGNNLARVANIALFSLPLLTRRSNGLSKSRADLVIASSPHPFTIFGASKIARSHRARLVFEVRDLWPLTLIELTGLSRRNPLILAMQYAEEFAYRTSDHVVSLLPKADRYMMEHGMEPRKFVYLPNGIDVDEWRQLNQPLPALHEGVLRELRRKGFFIVGYAGSHSHANCLHTLIEASRILKSQPVATVLVGQGPEKDVLQKMADQACVKNVVFLPPLPKSALGSLFEAADVLFIGWKDLPLYRYGISPNKLLDYMMAGKPVIHATRAGNDPVAESGCGVSIPPENASFLAQAVLKLKDTPLSERTSMGLRGRKHVLEHYDYRALACRFLKKVV